MNLLKIGKNHRERHLEYIYKLFDTSQISQAEKAKRTDRKTDNVQKKHTFNAENARTLEK